MRTRLVVATLFLLAWSGPVAAQWPAELRPGRRIQVRVLEREAQIMMGPRGQDLRGTLAGLAPDTLYLRITDSLGTLAIPRRLVRRLQISRGVPSRMESAARMGLQMGAVYALLALIIPDDNNGSLTRSEAVLVSGGVGLAGGAIVGALFPVERWKGMRFTPHLTSPAAGALSLGLGVR